MTKNIILKNKIINILSDAGVQTPAFEALIIIKQVTGKHYINLIDSDITKEVELKINDITQKRKEGYPLQYILGYWDFWGMNFKVGKGVLIPRPETELLVEATIDLIDRDKKVIIADLCSGTGCIALAIGKELKNSEIFAIEKSEQAYGYLQKNKYLNQVKNVTAILDDVLDPKVMDQNTKFDIIISNPPYIPTNDIAKLQKEVKMEPIEALDGGSDGLYFYRNITKIWKTKLKSKGNIIFEIGIGQLGDVFDILSQNGFINIKYKKDLNGIDRVIFGEYI